ncbi:MAG: phosphotransferase, partial [Xanthomonadales bacterium]|nr:phosphotransferase [Xanthomonadales bacterium]
MSGAARPEERLPLERLDPWLKAQWPDLQGEAEVTQYSGGASNWTYRLKYPERDLILRRAPAGTKAKGAHDMGREYRLLAALKPVYPLVPEPYLYSDDETLIGTEFFIMAR